MQDQAFHWRQLLNRSVPVLAVLMTSTYLVMVAALALLALAPTGKRSQYAVQLPPWLTEQHAVAVAAAVDGLLLDRNWRTGMALMQVQRADAVGALYRAGAWIVLDPDKLVQRGLGSVCRSRTGQAEAAGPSSAAAGKSEP